MENSELESILKLIDKDFKNNNLKDIGKIIRHLRNLQAKIQSKRIFNDDDLEKKKAVLTLTMDELVMPLKTSQPKKDSLARTLGSINCSPRIYQMCSFSNLSIQRFDFDKKYFCLAHLLQFNEQSIRMLGGIGATKFELIKGLVKEEGLDFSSPLGEKENERLIEYMKKKIDMLGEPPKEKTFKK